MLFTKLVCFLNINENNRICKPKWGNFMAEKRRNKKAKKTTKNAYYHGNVAYDVAPAYIPEPERPYKKPTLKPNRLTKKEKAEQREAFRHSFKLICSIILIFAGCLVMMVSYATVTQQRIENQNLREKLAKMQSENISVEADLTNQLNLDYVATQAKERLGMAEPQTYQVVYIDVPKQSYTVQYDVTTSKEEQKFSWKKLMDFFRKE